MGIHKGSGKSPKNLKCQPDIPKLTSGTAEHEVERKGCESWGPIETGLLLQLVHHRLKKVKQERLCDAVRRKGHEAGGPINSGLLLWLVCHQLQKVE